MAEVTLDDVNRKIRDSYEKAFSAMERDNLQYAMDTFMRVLELEPGLLQARRFLRAAQVKQFKDKNGGNLQHALSMVSGLGKYLSALSALKKDPRKALCVTEELMRIDPLNKMFVQLNVQAALAADLPEAAVLTLEVAREYYPRDVELLKQLGKLYLDQNQTQKGQDVFEVLLSLKPNDPEVLKAYKDATALETMNKGGWSDAGSYRDIIKDTGQATRLEQEAKAVKTGKDIADLIADSIKKIEREPGNVNYRRALADLYVRSERIDEAIQTLTEAQELSGGADPQIERAISVARLKQVDMEIARLQEDGQTEAAEAKVQEREAMQLQDAADRVKRYPNDLQFRFDYGVFLFEDGQLTEAVQQFQQAQRNPQRRIESLYYMARCFKEKQQFDIALEQLEKAASELTVMDQTKKDVLYELGTVCEAMDNKAAAARYFKEIYSVDIGYRDVAAKIDQSYA